MNAVFAEESTPGAAPSNQMHFRSARFRSSLRHKINTECIEAHRRCLRLRQLPNVGSPQAAKNQLLVPINGRLGGGHVVRSSRLDFNEAKQRPLPRNQIHIAGPLPADQRRATARISLAVQIEKRSIFAGNAGDQVRRQVRAAPSREMVESLEAAHQQGNAHLSESHGKLCSLRVCRANARHHC